MLKGGPSTVSVVSIITIVKDHPAGLKLTLESICNQTFSEWDLVIVVGGDNFDCHQIAANLARIDPRVKYVTQDSVGIYQAMNEGVKEVSSEFVWFMNAGDTFANRESLDFGLKTAQKHDVGLVIGNYKVTNLNRAIKLKSGKIHLLSFAFSRRGICHQSMIFRTKNLNLENLYDLKFKYSADYKLALHTVKNFGGFRVRETLCEMEPNGISDRNLRLVHLEKGQIRAEIFGDSKIIKVMGIIWTRALFIKIKARSLFKRGIT